MLVGNGADVIGGAGGLGDADDGLAVCSVSDNGGLTPIGIGGGGTTGGEAAVVFGGGGGGGGGGGETPSPPLLVSMTESMLMARLWCSLRT